MENMTTCSYVTESQFKLVEVDVLGAESQFKSVEVEVLVRKGSVSYGIGANFYLPHCLVVGQGIGLSSENHLRLA